MLVVLATTAVVSSAEVTSAALAPTAPYTVFTIDGGEGAAGVHGSRIRESVTFTSAGESVNARPADDSGPFISVRPPTGGTWLAGTTYQVTRGTVTASVGFVNIEDASPPICDTEVGTLTVHQVARSGPNVNVFAATYNISCDDEPGRLTGEIRWNSTVDYVAAAATPDGLFFGNHPDAPQTVTFTGKGSQPITFGLATLVGATPAAYSISADTCTQHTLAYGQTCAVTVTPQPGHALGSAGLAIPDNTAAGKKYVDLSPEAVATGEPTPPPTTTTPPTVAVPPNKGTYYSVASARILDTRLDLGAANGPVGPDSTVALQVAGRGGVPATGVSAVVLNVTATGGTADTYLTVYPADETRPTASVINSTPGWAGANSVTIALSASGSVDLYNHAGTVDVIADVVGFYATDSSMVDSRGFGSQYFPMPPYRAFDSREDWNSKVPAGWAAKIPLSFGAGFDSRVRSVVVNVTAVDPDGPGYLSAWDGSGTTPQTSTLNYVRGATVPNLAVVATSMCVPCGDHGPSITVYTHASSHIVVDVLGVFLDPVNGSPGLVFSPRTPLRIADTRLHQGAAGPLGQFATATFLSSTTLWSRTAGALAMNVTAVTPTASTFLTVWPAGLYGVGMPTSSNLNPSAGQTIPNAVYTQVGDIGSDKAFHIYNNSGSVDVVVDVVGAFTIAPAWSAPTTSADRNASARNSSEQAAGPVPTRLPALLRKSG